MQNVRFSIIIFMTGSRMGLMKRTVQLQVRRVVIEEVRKGLKNFGMKMGLVPNYFYLAGKSLGALRVKMMQGEK